MNILCPRCGTERSITKKALDEIVGGKIKYCGKCGVRPPKEIIEMFNQGKCAFYIKRAFYSDVVELLRKEGYRWNFKRAVTEIVIDCWAFKNREDILIYREYYFPYAYCNYRVRGDSRPMPRMERIFDYETMEFIEGDFKWI